MDRPADPTDPIVQLIADLRLRNVELAIKVVNLQRTCRAMQLHLLGCGVIFE
jgi:hypothetical protein